MASIDEICGCEFEAGDQACVCMRPKSEAKLCCQDCTMGRHRLVPSSLFNNPYLKDR